MYGQNRSDIAHESLNFWTGVVAFSLVVTWSSIVHLQTIVGTLIGSVVGIFAVYNIASNRSVSIPDLGSETFTGSFGSRMSNWRRKVDNEVISVYGTAKESEEVRKVSIHRKGIDTNVVIKTTGGRLSTQLANELADCNGTVKTRPPESTNYYTVVVSF